MPANRTGLSSGTIKANQIRDIQRLPRALIIIYRAISTPYTCMDLHGYENIGPSSWGDPFNRFALRLNEKQDVI